MNEEQIKPVTLITLIAVAVGLGYLAYYYHNLQDERRQTAKAIVADLNGLKPVQNEALQRLQDKNQFETLASTYRLIEQLKRSNQHFPAKLDSLMRANAGHLSAGEPIPSLHPGLAERLVMGRLSEDGAAILNKAGIENLRVVDTRLPCPAEPGNAFRSPRQGGCGTPSDLENHLQTGDHLLFWQDEEAKIGQHAPVVVAFGLGADAFTLLNGKSEFFHIDYRVTGSNYNRYLMLLELPENGTTIRLYGIVSADGEQRYLSETANAETVRE